MQRFLMFLALVAVLALAPTAFAGDPGVTGYGGAGVVQAGTEQSAGSLPVTGLDLRLVGLAGLALLAAGVGLRVFARKTG